MIDPKSFNSLLTITEEEGQCPIQTSTSLKHLLAEGHEKKHREVYKRIARVC